MEFSRRDFLRNLAAGGTALLCGSGKLAAATKFLTKNVSLNPQDKHRPQIHTPFPSDQAWFLSGRFELYPLWALPGDEASFGSDQLEWTAYYRPKFATQVASPLLDSPGFYQVFVCRGWIKTSSGRYETGDFFSNWFYTREFNHFEAEEDAILLVKRQAFAVQSDYQPLNKRRADYGYMKLPFIIPSHDKSGLPFDVNSEFLLGKPFRKISKDMTAVTMLEFFHENTVAPSHYHENPVWHEFIYIQGGQLTPDGYYSAGDHIASLPDVKEGPYLACYENKRNFPEQWPQYADLDYLMRPVQNPWPKIFRGGDDGIYGVLFVHYGPFAAIRPLSMSVANWTILDPHELGPKG